jgi:L-aspartate oxidase
MVASNVMAIATETDFLIVGAGIAGLRAAIGLAEAGRVVVVTKEALGESNTNYAQGGIAVALGGDEDVSLHLADTIAAGDGLVDRDAARVLVEEGPMRVEELLRWGTGFDREQGRLMLTREGAQPEPNPARQWRCHRRRNRQVTSGARPRAQEHYAA